MNYLKSLTLICLYINYSSKPSANLTANDIVEKIPQRGGGDFKTGVLNLLSCMCFERTSGLTITYAKMHTDLYM